MKELAWLVPALPLAAWLAIRAEPKAPARKTVSMTNTPPPTTKAPTRARRVLSSTRRPTGALVSMMPNRIRTTIAPT